MDYQVRYSDLDAMDGDFRAQMAKWSEALSEINDKAKALIGTSNMSGNTADNMRSYFSGVYGSMLAGINAAMVSFQNNWLIYRQDYRDIDGADNTVIITSELESLGQALKTYQGQKEFVETEVRNAVTSVSDISHASFYGIDAVYAIHNEIDSKLTQLMSEVDSVESSHASSDFGQIDQTIQSLKALISEMLSQKTIYKTQFSETAFAASSAYQSLVSAYDAVIGDIQSKKELVVTATVGEKAHYENLEHEAKLRQKQAETVKTIAMGLCIVGGIAATVLTAGAASPILVGAISGGVTGALMAGVNTGADMYAAGGWDNMNWGEIGKEALIGGIKGAATGAVTGMLTQGSGAIGKCVLGKIPESASPIVQNAAKIGYDVVAGSTKNVITKASDRFFNSILHGEGEAAALESASDINSILGDAIIGGIKGGVSATASIGFEKYGDVHMEDYSVRGWIGANALYGGISETTAGVTSRFVKDIVMAEGNLEQRIEKGIKSAFDYREMIVDVTSGASSKAAQEYVAQKPRIEAQKYAYEKSRAFNEKNGSDTLVQLEEDGFSGVSKTKTGNLDFSTAIDANGEKVLYSDEKTGIPADVEFKMVNGKTSSGDITKFVDAYREKIQDPSWRLPKGYTLQHMDTTVNSDGSITCRGQLVKTEAHEGYPHSGGASQLRNYYAKLEEYGGKRAELVKMEGSKEYQPQKDDLTGYDTGSLPEAIKSTNTTVRMEKDFHKESGDESNALELLEIEFTMPF